MKIFYQIEKADLSKRPITLTIGNFDGVHLGHQSVITRTISYAKANGGVAAVLTFQNHPTTVLQPEHPTLPLCTPEHKVYLLEQLEIDFLLFPFFTKEFSNQTAEDFLRLFRKSIPFSQLVLGHDARIGKNRKGDQETIRTLALSEGFSVEYVDPIQVAGVPVSSRSIRLLIEKGDFDAAKNLLDRPYSIMGKTLPGSHIGTQLGFPTLNIDVSELCHPPYGVYAVKVHDRGSVWDGVANLGMAPTFRNHPNPVLEVYILNRFESVPGALIEVVPIRFLRPEIKFPSTNELKRQIAVDVEQAKKIFRIPPRP